MDRAQDAALTNRGTRQSERATRVMAYGLHAQQHAGPGVGRAAGGEQRASGAASLPSGERPPSRSPYFLRRISSYQSTS